MIWFIGFAADSATMIITINKNKKHNFKFFCNDLLLAETTTILTVAVLLRNH